MAMQRSLLQPSDIPHIKVHFLTSHDTFDLSEAVGIVSRMLYELQGLFSFPALT